MPTPPPVHFRDRSNDALPLDEQKTLCDRPILSGLGGAPLLAVISPDLGRVTCVECRDRLARLAYDAEGREATVLTADRDRLVAGIHDEMCHHEGSYRECERKADRLIESGAVVDAATLAAEFRRQADPSTGGIWREACDLLDQVLAAALSERVR